MVHVRFIHFLVLAGTAYLSLTVDSAKTTSEKIIDALPRKEPIILAKVESSVSNPGNFLPVSTEEGRNSVGNPSRLSKTPTGLAFVAEGSTTNGLPTTEESNETTTGKIGIPLGSACRTNQECVLRIANSQCELDVASWKRTCQCLPSSNQLLGHCLPRLTGLGQRCTTNEECAADTPNSTCNFQPGGSGTCQCLPTHQQIFSMCELPGPGLGEKCRKNEDCSAKTPNSMCKFYLQGYATCECLPTHEQDLSTCKLRDPGLSLGSVCTTNRQCYTNTSNSECKASRFTDSNTCQCVINYEKSGNTCEFMGIGLGSKCSTDTDCSTKNYNSECKYNNKNWDYTCQCLSGYEESYSSCELIGLRLGEQCTTNRECTTKTSNSECKYGFAYSTCQCSPGFEQYVSTCRNERIRLGSKCSSSLQCQNAISNSVCLYNYLGDSTCKCARDYWQSSSICVRYTEPSSGPRTGLIVVLFLGGFIVLAAIIVLCCCRCTKNRSNRAGVAHVIRPPPQNIWSMPVQQNFLTLPPPAGNMSPPRTTDMPPCYDQVTKPGVQNYMLYPPPQYNSAMQVPPPFVNPSHGSSGTATAMDGQGLLTQPGVTTPCPAGGYNNQAFNQSES